MPSTTHAHFASFLAALASITLAAVPSARAATINVPPVVVTGLAHARVYDNSLNQTYVRDGITMPSGPGTWSGPGFSAAIGTGDTIVVRIEAPAGQQFNINAISGGAEYFGFYLYWQTNTGDSGSNFPAATVTLENFTGTAMTNTYTLSLISDNGQAIVVNREYTVNGACSFTAIQMSFVVTEALASTLRNYNAVQAYSAPALSAGVAFNGNNPASPTVMFLSAIPVPGACCHGSTCATTLPLACTGANALFLGGNVACSPIVRGGTVNACCPADYNGVGGLDVQDIFDFLNGWFAGCP